MNDRVDSFSSEPNAKKLIHTKQGKAWLEQFELADREVAIFVANTRPYFIACSTLD